jgi:hypothetical protein
MLGRSGGRGRSQQWRPQNTIDNDPEKYILRLRVSSICPIANKVMLQEDGRRGERALGSFLSYGEFAGGSMRGVPVS